MTGGYFAKIPNQFIKSKEFDDKLILTIICLDRRRFYENVSCLSLLKLIESSGYRFSRSPCGSLAQFKNQLQFLIDNEMIEPERDINTLKPDACIDIKVLDNFEVHKDYTIITAKEIDDLLQSPAKIDKSKLFAVYLYIKSFMRNRNLDDNGNEFKDAKDNPSAFWGTISNTVTDVGVAKETVNKCLKEYLKLGLLKRHVVGSYVTKHSEGIVRINVPNIYVLNQEGWGQEIERALDKIKTFHNTTSFDPPALRGKKTKVSVTVSGEEDNMDDLYYKLNK